MKKIEVKDLKKDFELYQYVETLIKDYYLYSTLNIKNFIEKYNMNLGAFWYVMKNSNLKKDKHFIVKSQEETCLKNFGVSNIFKKVDYIQSKFEEEYGEGIKNPGQVKEIIKKRENTNLQKYGSKCTFSSNEVKEKIKKTNLLRYGYNNANSNPDIKEKSKKTRFKNKTQIFEGNEVKEFLDNWHLDRKPTAGDLKVYLDLTKNKSFNLTQMYKLILNENLKDNFNIKDSFLENLVEDFLKENDIYFIKHDRKIISPLELDFYIPKFNLGLEVNDIWSHNSSKKIFNKEYKPLDYHFNKTNLCEENNIRLIHLFEPHILDEHKWNVLKDIILSACHKTKRIYARNTKLIIDKAIKYKQFFEDNNINGYRKSNTVFMLLDKKTDEPLMGYCIGDAYFGKGKYDAEISRGACKLGYTVVGGASKLWSAIIKYYEEKDLKNRAGCLNSIVYYVDRNYYNGNSMNFLTNVKHIKNQLGFWNYNIETKQLENRNPKKHKEIKEQELLGKILVVGNAGTSVNVWVRTDNLL